MSGSARWTLRAATSAEHERLDAAFARLDLGRADDYRTFLLAHLRALLPLEAAVAAGPAWSGWSPRAGLLKDDLRRLGEPPEGPTAEAPPLTPGAAWGVQYVLEGSRLGARVLAARLFAEAPRRYLAAETAAGGWQGFQAELDAGLDALGKRGMSDAQGGAHLAFARFQTVADGG